MVSQQPVVDLKGDPKEDLRTTEDSDQGEKKERANNKTETSPIIKNTTTPMDDRDVTAELTAQPPPLEQEDSGTRTDGGTPVRDASEENGCQLTPRPCKTPEERGPVHATMHPDNTPRPPNSQVKDTAGDIQTG